MKKRIAIRTETSKNLGMGHITRMLYLAEFLKKDYEISFFISGKVEDSKIIDNARFRNINVSPSDEESSLKSFEPDVILIDMRDTEKGHLLRLRQIAPIITFDNAGNTSYADRVVNALPLPPDVNINANYEGINYLILDDKIKDFIKAYPPSRIQNILITFGGADPYNLSNYVYKIFKEIGSDYNLKFIIGPLYTGNESFPPYESIKTDNLLSELSKADMVITSFGMTVYEALYIGTYPVIINPTLYHNSLGETLSFGANLGVGGKDENIDKIKSGILSAIGNTQKIRTAFNSSKHYIDNKGKERIKQIIEKLIKKEKPECPVCSQSVLEVIKRNDEQNMYFCPSCNTISRDKDYNVSSNYESSYFCEDYKKQYGKTYLEDKDVINTFNNKRLDIIDELVSTKRAVKPLLEIGSAMGFFLEAAKNRGYDAEGIEISKYASSYSKYTLELNVKQGDFLKLEYSRPVYEVIALWYFIEHTKNFTEILKKAHSIMRDNGIIAISTPNCQGLTGKKDLISYASKVPDDHFAEFSPQSLSRLLQKCGFTVELVVSTGIHFERWLNGRKSIFFKNPIYKHFWEKKARKNNIGDTFEIYARKI